MDVYMIEKVYTNKREHEEYRTLLRECGAFTNYDTAMAVALAEADEKYISEHIIWAIWDEEYGSPEPGHDGTTVWSEYNIWEYLIVAIPVQ